MDNDQLHDQTGYGTTTGQDREARDYGLSLVSDAWLEEHLRQQGSD
ncbi:hypothetical protein GCM10025867_23100 [Frondihabitans sucicola]|uniref:Uncharacterized protein n=1 Tax=Frondihabitans sucicola TaxID=1268041 RepID=A0ABM8GNP7_9MICO|nr:hypothetical protein [Frondihabitans sucicola]BDZ50069.1 hypothetical protein GCM10025867_23100 [Frondihabitans sucicola]